MIPLILTLIIVVLFNILLFYSSFILLGISAMPLRSSLKYLVPFIVFELLVGYTAGFGLFGAGLLFSESTGLLLITLPLVVLFLLSYWLSRKALHWDPKPSLKVSFLMALAGPLCLFFLYVL